MKPFEPFPMPVRRAGESHESYREALKERRELNLNGRIAYLTGYVEVMAMRLRWLEERHSTMVEKVARLEFALEGATRRFRRVGTAHRRRRKVGGAQPTRSLSS